MFTHSCGRRVKSRPEFDGELLFSTALSIEKTRTEDPSLYASPRKLRLRRVISVRSKALAPGAVAKSARISPTYLFRDPLAQMTLEKLRERNNESPVEQERDRSEKNTPTVSRFLLPFCPLSITDVP